jgi:hypothetical protein
MSNRIKTKNWWPLCTQSNEGKNRSRRKGYLIFKYLGCKMLIWHWFMKKDTLTQQLKCTHRNEFWYIIKMGLHQCLQSQNQVTTWLRIMNATNIRQTPGSDKNNETLTWIYDVRPNCVIIWSSWHCRKIKASELLTGSDLDSMTLVQTSSQFYYHLI